MLSKYRPALMKTNISSFMLGFCRNLASSLTIPCNQRYDAGSEGATDPLLEEERVYEELVDPKPLGNNRENATRGNIYHGVSA